MTATVVLDGTRVGREIQADVLAEVVRLREAGVVPGLAVVIVGDNPASQVYVRSKVRTCLELGMHSEKIELPSEATTEEVLERVADLNRRAEIHGILVQTPL